MNPEIKISKLPTGDLSVRFTGSCNAKVDFADFGAVAIIVDPHSKNPGLHLPRPLGFRMVRRILDAVGVWLATNPRTPALAATETHPDDETSMDTKPEAVGRS